MKRVISLVLILIMLLPTLICLTAPITAGSTAVEEPAKSKSLCTPKVVSVIYDDSDTMYQVMKNEGKNWGYANYAMQAFCSMLNTEDQLYITYMSKDQTSTKVDLSSEESINKSLNELGNYTEMGGTVYEAIVTAHNQLKKVAQENINKPGYDPNTEYWMVMFSDGGTIYNTEKNIDEILNDFASTSLLDNGQNLLPQTVYLGIGDDAVKPNVGDKENIYTYFASDGPGIVEKMNEMADRITGRSRLGTDKVTKQSENVIQVSAGIPPLNFSVLVQNSEAKIESIKCGDLTITDIRSAFLYLDLKNNPKYKDSIVGVPDDIDEPLKGGSFLVGNSKVALPTGNYTITFDKEINLEDVVVLVEPAAEMKAFVTVNGAEVTDLNELNYLMAKDKISVSYKLYETGTDKEIQVGTLSDTTYKVEVYEDGNVVKSISNPGEMLIDYELKNKTTKIIVAITIKGFNPMEFSVEFTPENYTRYIIKPTRLETDPIKSVWVGNISENKDTSVSFTVSKAVDENDTVGTLITDPQVIKAIKPVITTSPQGNEGEVTYTDDGKIVFTPKSASKRQNNEKTFDVTVTCTVRNNSGSDKYTVDASEYSIVYVAPDKNIKKTELYGNEIAATFYITRDGEKMSKADIGNFSYELNRSRKDLKIKEQVDNDGTITLIPYSETEHKKGFFLLYWMKYFALNGTNITITMNHEYSSSTTAGTIDVVGGDGLYVFFNVLLWLGIEILVALAIIAYIFRFMTKARFNPNAKIYFGRIALNNGASVIRLNRTSMKGDKVKNLWNPFKPLTFEVGGISLKALYGGMVLCDKPYFEARIIPIEGNARTAQKICEECKKSQGRGIEIQSVTGPKTIEKHLDTGLTSDDNCFYVLPRNVKDAQGAPIEEAYVFCYVIEESERKKRK